MDAQALTGYIWQGIRKEVTDEEIRLYLPFFFGEGAVEPLCLIWDKKGVLSDGGRTLAELKKRTGDLRVYEERIKNVLAAHGAVTLEGGHKLVVRHYQTCICGEDSYLDYMAGLNRLLRVISLLMLPQNVTVDEDGVVSLC